MTGLDCMEKKQKEKAQEPWKSQHHDWPLRGNLEVWVFWETEESILWMNAQLFQMQTADG